MPRIGAEPRQRSNTGASQAAELFQHLLLYRILPPVVLQNEPFSGMTSGTGAEVDIRLAGRKIHPPVYMEVSQGFSGNVRDTA